MYIKRVTLITSIVWQSVFCYVVFFFFGRCHVESFHLQISKNNMSSSRQNTNIYCRDIVMTHYILLWAQKLMWYFENDRNGILSYIKRDLCTMRNADSMKLRSWMKNSISLEMQFTITIRWLSKLNGIYFALAFSSSICNCNIIRVIKCMLKLGLELKWFFFSKTCFNLNTLSSRMRAKYYLENIIIFVNNCEWTQKHWIFLPIKWKYISGCDDRLLYRNHSSVTLLPICIPN